MYYIYIYIKYYIIYYIRCAIYYTLYLISYILYSSSYISSMFRQLFINKARAHSSFWLNPAQYTSSQDEDIFYMLVYNKFL